MRTFTMKSSKEIIKQKNLDNSLIKAKYSSIPVNVPFIYPSCLKGSETTLECFDDQTMREMIETDPGAQLHKSHKSKYAEIKRQDNIRAIEVIVKNRPHITNAVLSRKKKGSMYISELWSSKHFKTVVKNSGLERAFKKVHEAEREGLQERLSKLEQAYEKREAKLNLLDPDKVLDQFLTRGLNSPHLKKVRNFSYGGDVEYSPFNPRPEIEEVDEVSLEQVQEKPISRKNNPKKTEDIPSLLLKIRSTETSPSRPCKTPFSATFGKRRVKYTLSTEPTICGSPLAQSPKSQKSLNMITDPGLKRQDSKSMSTLKELTFNASLKKIQPSLKLLPVMSIERFSEPSCTSLDSKDVLFSKLHSRNESVSSVKKVELTKKKNSKPLLKAKTLDSRVMNRTKGKPRCPLLVF